MMSTYNSRAKVKRGVPQGSVSGHMLFNMIINGIYAIDSFGYINCADDNILCVPIIFQFISCC